MTTPITFNEAVELLNTEGADVYRVLNRAHEVRMKNRPHTVNLCGIVNAKSGMCTEDCKFCAQSAHNSVDINCYNLMDADMITARAKESSTHKASRFSIVTSGLKIEDGAELNEIKTAIKQITDSIDIRPCTSLGNVSKKTLLDLKNAGLKRYHCNLETSESYYSSICTTRPWKDSVQTIKYAKEAGLEVCSGGLFGLGENSTQRAELLETLKTLNVDSVPLNFFYPVKGTRINIEQPVSPLECLKIVAVARLMMPDKEIRVCGGREFNLGDLQSWIFISGADGMMIGGYLTTRGRAVEDDLKMISDAGFKISP